MLTKETEVLNINDAFASFFKKLGYDVTYEGRRETGERWHELYDAEGIICQVSFWTPLAEFLADLPYLVEGKHDIGPTDYWLACEDDKKLHKLLTRVQSAMTMGSCRGTVRGEQSPVNTETPVVPSNLNEVAGRVDKANPITRAMNIETKGSRVLIRPCYLSTVYENHRDSPPLPEVPYGEDVTHTMTSHDPMRLDGVIVETGWEIVSLMIGGVCTTVRPAAPHEGLFHPLGTTFMLIDPRKIQPPQEAVLRLRNASKNPLRPKKASVIIHLSPM
jgi:hypothetical protein